MKFFKIFIASLLAVLVGSVLSIFIWIAALGSISAAFGTNEAVTVDNNSVLVVDLSQSITDAKTSNPFAGFNPMDMSQTETTSLLSVLRAIDTAKEDSRIKGILIKLSGTGSCTLAQMEEIRANIQKFKEAGKFVVAFNNGYSQGSYLLSSVADKIYLEPEGGLSIMGLSSQVLFFTGLLEKLGISFDILRPSVCKYKSAVEPYFLKKMSDANREQNTVLINDLWKVFSEYICAARGIDAKQLDKIINNLDLVLAEDALKANLVDGLIYEDQLDDIFAELGAEKPKQITLGDYMKTLTNIDLNKEFVGIVYAEGSINDGEGNKDIYSKNLCKVIRKAADNDSLKAVVFRVNSPGGSALASDEIWREIELLKAKKPVIVSMGQYAASGGYYISCPADAILADRFTVTGSIGVFGMIPEGGNLIKNRIGLSIDGVQTHDHASMGANVMGLAINKLDPVEKTAMIRSVDKVYDTFTKRVAVGRNLTQDDVFKIAEGRVWSGERAASIGLVDTIGGLQAAIAVAADKAGLTEFGISEVEEELTGYMAILSKFNTSIKSMILGEELTRVCSEYELIKNELSRTGIQAYCPERISF